MSRLAFSVIAVLALFTAAWGQTYSLSFNRASNRMSWRPSFPSWSFSTPVTLAAAGDSTAQLRMNASASMNATLDQRAGRRIWSESANIRTSVLYPILGPRASIGINANMSSRSIGLQRQKVRSQTVSFRFQYRPLIGGDGIFEDLRVDVVPGLITARRASPVNPDSLIDETGLQYTGSVATSPKFQVGGRSLNTSLSVSKTDNTLEINRSRSERVSMSAAYTLPGDVRANVRVNESRSQTGVSRSVIDSADTLVVADLSERRSTSLSSSLSLQVFGFDVKGSQSWSDGLNTNTANAEEDPRNRFFARDRESQNWKLSGSVSGRLSETLVGSMNMAWATIDERRLPVTRSSGVIYRDPTDDREDRDLNVGGSLDWQLDDTHQIRVSGSVRMNRVDNPGDPEQDRDRYNRAASVSYRGNRESGLRYDVILSSSVSHRINLDATRAANNQRSSDLRLSINTGYERMGARVSHRFEISARRSIFDFDRELNPSSVDRRSNIRRGWSMRHSLQRSLFNSLNLNTGYTYSADDLGALLVEDQSQIVEQDNSNHAADFGMSYRPSTTVSLSVNYSYRLRRNWNITYTRSGTERDLSFRNPNRNLSVTFDYKPSGYTGMRTRFSRSKQRSGTFDTVNMSLTRTF